MLVLQATDSNFGSMYCA